MKSTEASGSAQHCCLTLRDMREPFQTEGPSAVKKDVSDGMLQVKADKSAKHEAALKTLLKGGMELEDLWWSVKNEIKQELELHLGPSSFYEATALEVGVKEEVEKEQHQDVRSYHSEAAAEDRIPEESSKAEKGQARIKPEPKPVVKRRRLTRWDMQKLMQTEDPKPTKKEFADAVKVKTEQSVQLQSSFECPEERMEMDDLWIQVRKEINKPTPQKLEPSEELAKLEGHEDCCRVKHAKC